MLREKFVSLVSNYTEQSLTKVILWDEIENCHSHKSRYYHNLNHLTHLFESLKPVSDQIKDEDIIAFSIFYHDIVYDIKSKKNELKSAELAVNRLTDLNISAEKTQLVYNQILATKSHSTSDCNDTNLFTDADLSILGADWDDYELYLLQIRQEYKLYPNLIYNPGRKKVLLYFLDKKRLFKTDYFYNKFEDKAKSNLEKELTLL
jgi:predicted metal-dependent HD superfamily phosphohydrolase